MVLAQPCPHRPCAEIAALIAAVSSVTPSPMPGQPGHGAAKGCVPFAP